MDLDETLLRLIGGIYDCVLDPESWNTVLPRIGAFVGGSGGGLFAHHPSRRSASIYYQFGTEAWPIAGFYLEKCADCARPDVRHLASFFGIGDVFSSSTIMPHADFMQSRFYKEWVRPQGWYDNIGVYLDRSSEGQTALVVFRNEREGEADEPARDRLRLLVPHLRRAVLIGNLLDFKTAEAATFADALDGLSAGTLFVDANGRITHANAAAQAMLAAGDVLRGAHGRLVAADAGSSAGAARRPARRRKRRRRRSASGAWPCRWSRATAGAASAHACRCRQAPAAAPRLDYAAAAALSSSRGCPSDALAAPGDRQDVSADADGAARPAGDRRGRRKGRQVAGVLEGVAGLKNSLRLISSGFMRRPARAGKPISSSCSPATT